MRLKPQDLPAPALPGAASLPGSGETIPDSRQYRTIWISDIHLGTAGCQADALLHFLKHNESDMLYLVGDIVDGWQLRKGWFWPQSHNDVVQKLLRKARKGTRVVFIPGNHDEAARQFAGMTFGDIPIEESAVHVTADGKRLWVVHGDEFDQVMRYARWLAYLGDTLYTFALTLNRLLNHVRFKLGYPYWSLSQYLKHQVKNAVNFILEFERALIHEAKHRGFDGVVCGHIHKAEIKQVDGLTYCNDGDWVESLTALVEHACGRLEIVHWPYRDKAAGRKSSRVLPQAVRQDMGPGILTATATSAVPSAAPAVKPALEQDTCAS